MIEAEVHCQLLAFVKQQGLPFWPHHLTMGRLVARALRLGKSALIQTSTGGGNHSTMPYHLSYLTPALLTDSPCLIVIPENLQNQLLTEDIPKLQQWLNSDKPIIQNPLNSISSDFEGLIITTPQSWLANYLENQNIFPQQIITIIDRADYLEDWAIEQLTVVFNTLDWDELIYLNPQDREFIRNTRIQLTKTIFAHPSNPYECYLLEQPEKNLLEQLLQYLAPKNLLTPSLAKFWQCWQNHNSLYWTSINREKGQFTLHITPLELTSCLNSLWQQQPIVFIGRFLDSEKEAPIYRQQLGIGNLLCLKFSPNRETEQIKLYLPLERIPLPNTPQFQGVLITQINSILRQKLLGLIVLLIEDTPLKSQVGATLAAEFGSRVQVEKIKLKEDSILVTGWQFWHENQEQLPTPQLLVIATLPIPSLENPLVAGKVAYYKRTHQDWFRFYLLPTALKEIQRSVIGIRQSGGVVAILDNRVNQRSYGTKILEALEPYIKINYFDRDWF